ncbi:MAG: ATP-dependent zinc metalloprotease FtsH [Mogibacterium sp.]|nr:ATP-dependent zinc metalloprotease FtsH [Mogibacterium sp.]
MKNFGRSAGTYLIIFVVVLSMSMMFRNFAQNSDIKEVKFSQFAQHLEKGDFESVNITDRKLTGTKKDGTREITYAPSLVEISWLEETKLNPMLEEGKIELDSEPPKSEYTLLNLLPTILMIAAMGFLFYFMMSQGGNKQAFQFGKNRARLYKNDGKAITFDDVAGLEEEKVELSEIVDFLKNPSKYSKLGARIPKGVLLVGQPGTGKTYISRATAGEAGVPFFTISGSDFVEMFVGVGASRVRDLFAEAKKNAPCIVFIDEIDAVGRRRGAGLGGGNDEREQTLNQLLVEMDGFDGNIGIIILAATNRPDVLDPALLRPGRFDRQVVIGMPDIKGREELFRLYTKNKPLADDVSPEILAKRTPGFSPADIENLINEAALLTARRNGTKIRMDEIEEATTKVMAGPQKKSRVISEAEKKLTAYHEAGHAIVMRATPDADPVHQITIIPRGMAGGFTMWLPEEDRFFETRGHMINTIKHLLGGRVAEELKLEDISTGASNDLERATEIARQMITKYGFSEKLGPVSFSSSDEVFLGRDFSTRQNYSEEVASEVDHEIRRLLNDCYDATRKILIENDAAFERVAQALLLVETLDGDQFERLFKGEIDPEGIKEEVEDMSKKLARKNKKEAEESARIQEQERLERQEEIERIQDKINGIDRKVEAGDLPELKRRSASRQAGGEKKKASVKKEAPEKKETPEKEDDE